MKKAKLTLAIYMPRHTFNATAPTRGCDHRINKEMLILVYLNFFNGLSIHCFTITKEMSNLLFTTY